MSFDVIYRNRIIPFNQDNNESDSIFKKRIDFYLTALDIWQLENNKLRASISFDQIPENLTILSFAYRNKLLYGSKYIREIEDQINIILKQFID